MKVGNPLETTVPLSAVAPIKIGGCRYYRVYERGLVVLKSSVIKKGLQR